VFECVIAGDIILYAEQCVDHAITLDVVRAAVELVVKLTRNQMIKLYTETTRASAEDCYDVFSADNINHNNR